MKKLTKLLTVLVVAFGGLGVAKVASADVSYNVGYVSEYYFRGVLQKTSSASAGVDFEENGFYVGAWAADVGDGIEVDGYLGYGIETEAGFSGSLGYTYYGYTGEFDDKYGEGNLNLGYGLFGLEYSFGEAGFFGADVDYNFVAGTLSFENGIYATYGYWDIDAGVDDAGDAVGDISDGYFEIGYGTTLTDAEIDVGVALIFSGDEISDEVDSDGNADESTAIVFSIGKSF